MAFLIVAMLGSSGISVTVSLEMTKVENTAAFALTPFSEPQLIHVHIYSQIYTVAHTLTLPNISP